MDNLNCNSCKAQGTTVINGKVVHINPEDAVLALAVIKKVDADGVKGVRIVHHSVHPTGPRRLNRAVCSPNDRHDEYGVDHDYVLENPNFNPDFFAFRYQSKLYLFKVDDERMFTAHFSNVWNQGYRVESELFGARRENMIEVFGKLL